MNTVIPGVEPAATPAAAEPKQFSSFAEERASWTPEQQKAWDDTGKEPDKGTAPPAVDSTITPEPQKAEVTPGSGPDDTEDQEPEYFGTSEQQKAQRHAFAKVKRERAEARAEAKILREQLAAKPQAAPAVALKTEPKAQPQSKIVRPELPDIADPKYDAQNGLKSYQDDMREFHRLDKEADRQERQEWLAEERRKDAAERDKRATASQWDQDLAAAQDAHADFEAVAFSEKLQLSLPMIGVFTAMKGGPEVLYQLGLNPKLAAELATDTAIPGGYGSYEELTAAAESNPQLARQLAAAEAIVRHEAKRILSTKPTPGPQPITITRATPPHERVNSGASATKDPIAEAWAQYDKTGDHKYLALANKLEDERDKEASRRR